MKIRRHYIAMRRHFAHAREHEPVACTTTELADILTCTQRNMVLLLNRMQQEQWLLWEPKRGRGNRSLLTFLASLEELVLKEAKELVDKQELQAALALIQHQPAGERMQAQFQEWLSGHFGFRSELEGSRRRDVLRFPLPQTIHTLDPACIHFFGESHLVNQLFDSLIRLDGKTQEAVPHLAHAWEADKARVTWTFYLRKGVLFHHGREMTAADVLYSLERLKSLAPQGLYSWVYKDIAGMEIVNETTIRIMLSKPNELFLSFLSTNRASIVPEELCRADGMAFGLKPIGTGPFRLESSTQGVWTLEAFQPYFQGRAFLDRVEVWSLGGSEEEEGKHEDLMNRSTFQVMHNARITEMDGGEWQQIKQSGTTIKFMTVNALNGGPMENAEIRAVINEAIDRNRLLELLSGDVLEPATTLNRTESREIRKRTFKPCNYASLKKRLREAGYEGQTLRLTTIPEYARDAELIQALLKEIDVPLELRLLKAEEFKGSSRMTADLLLFAVMLDEHRELRLIDLYASMLQHMNPQLIPVLDKPMKQLLEEPDQTKRSEHFLAMEKRLIEDNSLFLLYRKALKTAFHPSVQGISLESLGWVRFRDLWFR
ncbi:ABC transporter substrate-binding protein [Paenibacillus sp. HB172176]|uniref:ABC transporter substrate-binding protein n=1 Tax=Paenibacillus sp. HB172176 TaxID=2493690 RepID=UPI00143A4DEC|nr:ABC transporter substrate-binding protein [Paenibacillus sp. HB172176]